jgi:hypothetical protein
MNILDFQKKVNSDFPYSKRRGGGGHHHSSRKSYMIKNIIESLPEMVEEEKIEEEEIKYMRHSRFSVMMDHNEFGGARHRSLDGVGRRKK